MGNKRFKLARGLPYYVPVALSFTELEERYGNEDDNFEKFQVGDEGREAARLQDDLAYEQMVVTILANLEPREQLIFAFQLLRDSGYQIDYTAFARVIKLSRRQYMRILDDVRNKSYLYMMSYKQSLEQESHKEE